MIGENKKQQKEFGDYQTPEFFTDKICSYLSSMINKNDFVILEPNFGKGNFIRSSLKYFSNIKKIFGIEINKNYYNYAVNNIDNTSNVPCYLFNDDFFKFDFNKIKTKLNSTDELLLIGNPPWVTNSSLSEINSKNIPKKSNFKKNKGFDAITGKSNFDITEYIILTLLNEFKHYNMTLAMLCKNTVVKNIVKDIQDLKINISEIKAFEIDTQEIFKVSCDAVLLYMQTGSSNTKVCDVYNFNTLERKKTFGWYNNKFVSDMNKYCLTYSFDGNCQLEWRQGIKHDCSKIFELVKSGDNKYVNGQNDILNIENHYVYPLFKSSDLKKYVIDKNRKSVIITQKKINQETHTIQFEAPKIWKYLCQNENLINKRKSSIYKKAPKFSMFGIGDYSFSRYKVAISGFYKEPRFSLIVTEKPAMLDDTCYFLSFENLKDAQICTVLLNSNPVQNFLKSIVFTDSKRPYTKDILKRIDFKNICNEINYDKFIQFSSQIDINNITINDYKKFQSLIDNSDKQLKLAI